MIAFIVIVVLMVILLVGDRYVAVIPAGLVASLIIITLGVAAGYAFLLAVGGTIEHFTQ